MRKAFNIMTALALGATLAGGAAWAQDGDGEGRHSRKGMRGALRSLNLSDDQREQVLAKFSMRREQMKPLREQMKADRQALRSTVDVANPDPTAVGKAFLKVKADREAIKSEMQSFRESLRPILTEEQNGKLDGYVSAMRERGPRFHDRSN